MAEGICDCCKKFAEWKGQKRMKDEYTLQITDWNLCAECFDAIGGL